MTDAIQRFVGIATPVARIALARRSVHARPLGARGVVRGLDRSDRSERRPRAAGDRRTACSSLRAGDRRAARSCAPAETDARALSQAAPHPGRLGSRPAASPPCAALDRQWRIRSEHARKDGEGARRRGASRRRVDRRASAVDDSALPSCLRDRQRFGCYHFNLGRPALATNGYRNEWLDGIPEDVIASFAGTGNPFAMGMPSEGEYVVDVGSGAGLDGHIAAKAVGPSGHVIGVEMTDAMLEKARRGIADAAIGNFEIRQGYAESLPVPDGWADLVISNGSANLSPDKSLVFGEMFRALQAGGSSPDRRHHCRAAGPGGGEAQHRLMDELNSRGSARSRAPGHGRGRRLRGLRDHLERGRLRKCTSSE